MRLLLAGLLNLALTSVVWAQAVGDIEAIGFGHQYRANTWTPMVVRLSPTSGSNFEGKLEVSTYDLDQDRVHFTRVITLTGNPSGSAAGGGVTQRFWMYFIPHPRLFGDTNNGDPNELNRERHMEVWLCKPDGTHLVKLPIKDAIIDIDADADHNRSSKLVLCVVDQSRPSFGEYRYALGLKENVHAVTVPISNVRYLLPENAVGYESVDTVVWFDADPANLDPSQRAALEEYVARGGKLVVCHSGQPNKWKQVADGFADLLPVTVQQADTLQDVNALTALQGIVRPRVLALYGFNEDDTRPGASARSISASRYPVWEDQWKRLWAGTIPPFQVVRARAKGGAVVAEWQGESPWLVRWRRGLGSVTWVAQDLGELSLVGNSKSFADSGVAETRTGDYRWPYLWDRVLGWANDAQPYPADWKEQRPVFPGTATLKARYGDDRVAAVDLTQNTLAFMDFTSTGAGLLGLAVLFFIVYWILTGPASYLFLAARKRSGQSWFVYCAIALVATVATVAIVRLVLRGSPQVKHVSYVTVTAGEPAVVRSQFGLYIPRDGMTRVQLTGRSSDAVSYVTAYPLHSDQAGDRNDFPAKLDYEVPVLPRPESPKDLQPWQVDFPYRSTLKKLQARWIGPMENVVVGKPKLLQQGFIGGVLVNQTGRTLQNLRIIFHYPQKGVGIYGDWILSVPGDWAADAKLDLQTTWRGAQILQPDGVNNLSKPFKGIVGQPGGASRGNWDGYYYRLIGGRSFAGGDHGLSASDAFPLLSLYQRFPAMYKQDRQTSGNEEDLYYLKRPSLRQLDLSDAVAAGAMLVLAEADGAPLPMPLEVEGQKMQGEGKTFYQFVLPIDRTEFPNVAPTTQAAFPQ